MPDDYDRWLDPTTTIEELRTILKAAFDAYLADAKAGRYPPRAE